jgi:hypothetical protein
MTQKVYKTAQGKTVDLGALMLQNENTRAVGNMKVNARGDLVDGWNRPIDSRTHQVQKQYERQITNVKDEPVRSSIPTTVPGSVPRDRIDPALPVESAKPAVRPQSADVLTDNQGLAAAIARARQIQQEPVTRAARSQDKNTGAQRT